jgi:hypothetical protein
LVHYLTHADGHNFQPANISFDLLPPIEGLPRQIARDRRARREKQCERALKDFESWLERPGTHLSVDRIDSLPHSIIEPLKDEERDSASDVAAQ